MLALTAVGLYGTLAGPSPSTQRAMIMALILLAGWWVGRRHDWFNTLAAAGLILLILTPHALLSISFQLSFAAVITILLGMNQTRSRVSGNGTQGFWPSLVSRLAVFVKVTLLATAGTLPLIVFYFNQISLVGPLVNLVAVPLVGSVAVPLGLSGSLVAFISPGLAAWTWQAGALTLQGVLLAVRWASQWPFAAVSCVTPSRLELVLYYALIWLALTPGRRWAKITILGVIAFIGGMDAAYWIHQRFGATQLRVTALDVGQGTANLLQLPGGFTVLVDGGGFVDPRVFDVGQRIVAPVLWREKIRTVDLVVLSHPNADHLNGLIFILNHFNIGEVWSNHQPEDSMGYARWREAIEAHGILHRPFGQLPRKTALGGVTFEIFGPQPDFLTRGRQEAWRDLNENSLVLKVGYGDVSFLFAGDIGWRTEAELVRRIDPAALKSTVLFVAHHGSRKSSSMSFLEAVQPLEAVISAGWQNPFHFPHVRTLERLSGVGARPWRTDLCGAVRFLSDGRDYRVETCRGGN